MTTSYDSYWVAEMAADPWCALEASAFGSPNKDRWSDEVAARWARGGTAPEVEEWKAGVLEQLGLPSLLRIRHRVRFGARPGNGSISREGHEAWLAYYPVEPGGVLRGVRYAPSSRSFRYCEKPGCSWVHCLADLVSALAAELLAASEDLP